MLFYIIFGLLIIFITARVGILKSVKNPLLFTMLGLAFVHIFVPAIQSLAGTFRYGQITSELEFKALIFSLLYFICILLSYFFCQLLKRRTTLYFPLSKVKNEKTSLLYLFFIFWFIAIVGSMLPLLKIILDNGLAMYLVNRIFLLRGMSGYLLIAQTMPLFLTCFYFLFRPSNTNIFYSIGFSFLVLLMSAFFILLGSRNTIIIFVLQFILVYFMTVERVPHKHKIKMFLCGVMVISVLALVGHFRVKLNSVASGEASLKVNVVEVASETLVWNFGNNELLIWLMSNENKWDEQYGKTFVAAITNFVPRKLWADKPFGGGPTIRNFIVPGSYSLTGKNMTSFTTGILIESYMNFGWFGIFLGIFHGAALSLVHRLMEHSQKDIFATIICAYTLLNFGFFIFYQEFLGLFTRYVMTVTPVIIMFLLFKTKQVRI